VLTSLHIENFRGFRDFKMTGLGRVNLLVGRNNSGKSSVLDAIHLLAGVGEQRPIVSALIRRGEFDQDYNEIVFDFSHLRHGHQPRVGEGFTISANTGDQAESVAVTFARGKRDRMRLVA
jgi:recombinational DNA repair ATPase RecF